MDILGMIVAAVLLTALVGGAVAYIHALNAVAKAFQQAAEEGEK